MIEISESGLQTRPGRKNLTKRFVWGYCLETVSEMRKDSFSLELISVFR